MTVAHGEDRGAAPKVGVISLGCAKNLVDTELYLGALTERGFSVTTDENEADVLLVNTCGFIDEAKEESVGEILAACEVKRRGRCRAVVVVGCLVQRYGEELARELPEVDAFVGLDTPEAVADAVAAALAGRRYLAPIKPAQYLHDEHTPRLRATPRWTAWVKIAEGCDRPCSFCVIPKIRGRLRSRTPQSLLAEVNALVEQGAREINLIAQDTTQYGMDLDPPTSLDRLLTLLARETDVRWLRVLYCFPDRLTPEIIEAIATHENIVRYIDLPLQHADDKILRDMGRPGNAEQYERLIADLRRAIPGVAIRTAMIVGFPGETEERFARLVEFVERVRFDRLFVFRFSPEEGTPAAKLPDQVPAEVAEERFHRLMSVQRRISYEINKSLVGQTLRVLLEREGQSPGAMVGRSERDAPEVDCEVHVVGTEGRPGQFVDVRITRALDYDLVGQAVGAPW